MSAAAAAETATAPKGKKKLILIVAAVAVLALGGGGAALVLTKKKAAAEEAADGEGESVKATAAKQTVKFDPKAVPVFVPLDTFTVNLADRDAERYAQIGITLEIDDAKTGEMMKVYMPAIRNHILMAIADRTAAELMGREGKAKLSERIRRDVSRTIGFEVPEEAEADPADDEAEEDKPKKKPKAKAKKKAEPALPVKAVHFSNFIIQ
jgi:flagellar protein FliL